MQRFSNAFKLRVADRTILDTSLFLQLYSPTMLSQLEREDFEISKLIVLRGSPGSGKSSLLRLFEGETLLTLYQRNLIQPNQGLITQLENLGVWGEDGPRVMGIYIHCDSSLSGIDKLDVEGQKLKLLNTILDVRIIKGFLRALSQFAKAQLVSDPISKWTFAPLPPDSNPATLFQQDHTIDSLKEQCDRIESDFATLLNSFPGDPVPSSIQPHSQIFSIAYLGLQKNRLPKLSPFIPIVLLDDVHELYKTQREHVHKEFLRRVSIPRWIATRKHVYELEDLISLEGANPGRDIRELDLDFTTSRTFQKFVDNVASRRLKQSFALHPYNVESFAALLSEPEDTVTRKSIQNELEMLQTELEKTGFICDDKLSILRDDTIPVALVEEFVCHLILAERQKKRPQPLLFTELEALEPTTGKILEAARLFAAEKFNFPYYHSFNKISNASNGNIEQFLAIGSDFADRIIFRAELGRELSLTASEQENLLRSHATTYFNSIEHRFRQGLAIKQLVKNLADFFKAVTFRPNAPIAPGVTGFGLNRSQLRQNLEKQKENPVIDHFRQVITSAVANNIFSVHIIKQGQSGSEKVVFYLNRLLCVQNMLPLNFGGWQQLGINLLIKMMRGPVPARELGKKWVEQPFDLMEGDESLEISQAGSS